jgi:hypothetical protein
MLSFERVAWGAVVLRLRGLCRPPVNPTLFLLFSRLMVRNHRKFSRTPELYAPWNTLNNCITLQSSWLCRRRLDWDMSASPAQD